MEKVRPGTTMTAAVKHNTMLKTLLVLWLSVSSSVMGYSRGAPDTTCDSLTPGHGLSRQDTPSPYIITPSAANVDGGKRMLVTLKAPDNDRGFKGFLVQARRADSQEVVGTFFTTDHSYITCGRGFNNAVTHSSPTRKSKVTLEWEAPHNFQGEIVFTGSFVKDYDVYWVGVTSEKVVVKRTASTGATAPAPAVVPAAATTARTASASVSPTSAPPAPAGGSSLKSAMQNIYLRCESSKGCFGFPPGCENSNNCDMLMTYSKASSGYLFEIMGSTGSSSGYVAGALSSDTKMGTDSVMACMSINGNVNVAMAFNEGKSNEILTNGQYGLTDIQTAQVDGQVFCSFIRQTVTEIKNIEFNLADERFHLMLARGPASENQLRYHDKKIFSTSTASLDKFEILEGANAEEIYATLHASFMIAAWVCAASCGIMLARYYKKTWLQHKSCGIDQWFHLHRFFMGLTWALTIAGFVLIAYSLKGWTNIKPEHNPHAIIGIISVGLCFIQPFMAMCRCAPTHKNRPIFNWFHWFVGNSAQILGLTAIFFGLQLYGSPMWTWFILIVFIAFHCMVHLILSVGQCVSDSKSDHSNNVFPMKDMNGSRSPLHPADKQMDAPGATFRKVILGIYFIFNWLITALLIFVVVVGEKQLRDWNLLFWEH